MSNKPRIEVGTQLGEYRVEAYLGGGGQADLWRAVHPVLKKQVAIKVLKVDAAEAEELEKTKSDKPLRRFELEARSVTQALEKLTDEEKKHLVQIFSFGDFAGNPYYVMECLQGKSLSSYLAEKGPLPFSLICEILSQLCKTLDAIHQKALLIHRDLKPDNIFLVTSGGSLLVKLLDFGIVKSLQESGLTKSASAMGTPAYMPPEQLDAKYVGHRSDLYSLGITAYEMICGRTPFLGKEDQSTWDLIIKHLHAPPLPPSSMVTGRVVPSAVDRVILQSLSKNPDQRQASAGEFFKAFYDALGSLRGEKREEIEGATPRWEVSVSAPKLVPVEEDAPNHPTPKVVLSLPKPVLFGVAGLVLGLLLYLLFRVL